MKPDVSPMFSDLFLAYGSSKQFVSLNPPILNLGGTPVINPLFLGFSMLNVPSQLEESHPALAPRDVQPHSSLDGHRSPPRHGRSCVLCHLEIDGPATDRLDVWRVLGSISRTIQWLGGSHKWSVWGMHTPYGEPRSYLEFPNHLKSKSSM